MVKSKSKVNQPLKGRVRHPQVQRGLLTSPQFWEDCSLYGKLPQLPKDYSKKNPKENQKTHPPAKSFNVPLLGLCLSVLFFVELLAGLQRAKLGRAFFSYANWQERGRTLWAALPASSGLAPRCRSGCPRPAALLAGRTGASATGASHS